MENLVPVIDTKILQEKANEYAQLGAEKTLKEFYTGYNSPYIKAINENLENRGFDSNFELPDVVANINAAITTEIDNIANSAIAKTFVPLVTKFLTRADKEMNLSEILKKFIEYCDFNHEEESVDDYTCSIVDSYEHEPESCLHGYWHVVSLSNYKKSFEIRLYKKDKKVDLYEVTSLPSEYTTKGRERTMKLTLSEGATLEMPFTQNVLHDDFMCFLARLIMAETKITIDVKDFDEDMFPERDNCHC
jgi:hypothetical protein